MSEEDRLKWLKQASKIKWSRSSGEIRDYWAWTDGNCMFVKIHPGGRMHPHTDNGMRRHYVLQTNPKAVMTVDGIEYHLEQGEIYDLDTALMHSSVNNGDTDRIHRIIG